MASLYALQIFTARADGHPNRPLRSPLRRKDLPWKAMQRDSGGSASVEHAEIAR